MSLAAAAGSHTVTTQASGYLPVRQHDDVDWVALRRPFPPEQVSTLPRTAKRPALDYVGHAAVTNRLNEAAPGWTYRIDPVVVHGNVVVEDRAARFVPDPDGLPHVIAVFGEMRIAGVARQEVGEVDSFSTYGLELKNAISDFIRRAAMRFGVGLDLWSKEELPSAGESTAGTSTLPRPGAQAGTNAATKAEAVPASPVTPSESGFAETPRGDVPDSDPSGAEGSPAGGPVPTAPASGDLAGMTLSELMNEGTKLSNNSKGRFRKYVNEFNGTHYTVPEFEQLVTHEELEVGVRRLREFAKGGG